MNKSEKTFIEIHMLQNYAPSNLNRDDTGSVKDCTFGGYPRARISSQCRKRSIRTSEFFKEALEGKLGERTKFLPEEIKDYLIKEKKFSNEVATQWAEKFMSIGKSDKKSGNEDEKANKKKKEDVKEEAILQTAQLMFYGKDELHKIIDWIVKNKDSKIPEKIEPKDIQKALSELKAKPVDIALFGRMTTLEAFEDVNAACQVSHAISVNQFSTDFDYFTAVDDLKDKYQDHEGSAFIQETEFTSSCFYQYYAIDYDAFVKSIGDEKDGKLARSAIAALMKAATLSHPTGKQNSFAAHNPAHFIGIEIKSKKIPTNLANAFIKPVKPTNNTSLIEEASSKLADYAVRNRKAFSLPVKEAAVFLFDGKDKAGKDFTQTETNRFDTLDEIVSWLEKQLEA
jgi:CRISPR system Cascade subunit CasC